ncbi:MAG TPA: hypothetical protein DCF91_07245 [Porphyromonadaceae bacterium]|nr:hypothetical protein [Porphyromonadaceae bacterium]
MNVFAKYRPQIYINYLLFLLWIYTYCIHVEIDANFLVLIDCAETNATIVGRNR